MIQFDQVTFTYPGAITPAIQEVSLELAEGRLALVCGLSGSGKSTLLRCINGLVPHFSGGELSGSIRVNGLDPVRASPQVMSRQVGFVNQDPEAQFVVDVVEDELAFALENAAVPPVEMHARVEAVMELLELTPLRERRLETLSGGERQRVAIGAALALQPHILVLDEPTSQLDPGSAEELLEALVRLRREAGISVVLAEHRLERVLQHCDQLIYLESGIPGVRCGPPAQVLEEVELASPLVRLGKALGWKPLPLAVEAARPLAKAWLEKHQDDAALVVRQDAGLTGEALLIAEGVQVAYGQTRALDGVSLQLKAGEVLALMGPNGAGKTTLLRCLVGLLRLQSGRVLLEGEDIARREVAEIAQRVGYLPQDPNALLFSDTVLDELLVTLHNHAMAGGPGIPDGKASGHQMEWEIGREQALRLLRRLGLQELAGAYPRDLSTGERQRVALGAITVTQPKALLLDEPTRGLDTEAKRALLELLHGWRDEGMAILLATHDVELAAQAADRVVVMERGQVMAQGDAAEVLGAQGRFTPQIAQLFPGKGWLTVEHVLGSLRPPNG